MTLLADIKMRHAVTGDVSRISLLQIYNRGPVTETDAEDPDGEREYEYEVPDGHRMIRGHVRHRRGDGALVLVQKVLNHALKESDEHHRSDHAHID